MLSTSMSGKHKLSGTYSLLLIASREGIAVKSLMHGADDNAYVDLL
jgi:hypothetical protein